MSYVLFGAGACGQYAYERIKASGRENEIACFADTKRIGSVGSCRIHTPHTARHLYPEAKWVSCVMRHPDAHEIDETLARFSVETASIFDVVGYDNWKYPEDPSAPDNLRRALSTYGFMDADELEYLAGAAKTRKRIVEIGSWMGRSACALGVNTPGTVFCVDRWIWGGHDDVLPIFSKNTFGLPIIPVRMDSLTAALYFERAGVQFDMIFIDGDHTYPQVVQDISIWSGLLRMGGVLCGHDYGDPLWPHVKEAVDKLVGPVRIINRIWTTEGV